MCCGEISGGILHYSRYCHRGPVLRKDKIFGSILILIILILLTLTLIYIYISRYRLIFAWYFGHYSVKYKYGCIGTCLDAGWNAWSDNMMVCTHTIDFKLFSLCTIMEKKLIEAVHGRTLLYNTTHKDYMKC